MKSKPFKLCWKCIWVCFYCGLLLLNCKKEFRRLRKACVHGKSVTHSGSAASLKIWEKCRIGKVFLDHWNQFPDGISKCDIIPLLNCSGCLWNRNGFWKLCFHCYYLNVQQMCKKIFRQKNPSVDTAEQFSVTNSEQRRRISSTCWQCSS